MLRQAADSPAQGNDEHCLVTTKFDRERAIATRVFNPARPLGAVGDYDLVQQLGRCVFVGHHRVTKQAFAIRVLDPVPPGRPELIGRQLIVARAFASIDHPNVVRTIEVGVHAGRVYLVMEYLRGTTLESMIDMHGPLSIAQVIRIGAHLARGLEAVHQRGVAHRNLDAQTAIVVPSEHGRGTVKLVDFEIPSADDVVRIARHSMSPELVSGGDVDHRTDLYSLGVLLHRACTQQDPFEGSPIEILAMHRFRSVVRPPPVLAGVPAELAATIQRCLAVEPADRYGSAGEVIEALRHAAGELARRERPEAPVRPMTPLLDELDQLPTESRASARQVAPLQPPAPPAPVLAAAAAAAPAAPSLPPLGVDERAGSGRVIHAIDPARDSSGILIAPSGPARVVTALPMPLDASPARPRPRRRAMPWKPASILLAAFAAGALLSLWTGGGGGDVAPAPPAPPPPAEVRPAALPTVPSCPPSAPVLVPDVVLSADPVPSERPEGEALGASEDEVAPRKAPRRKSKSRRAKQASDAAVIDAEGDGIGRRRIDL